jgi:cytochrome P450
MPRTKFRQEIKVLDAFIYPYVHRSLKLSRQELETKIAARDNLLDSLTLHTRDAKFLRDQMITILLAARDTTAATLSFLFFELNRNPTVLEILRREISERLGTGSTAMLPTAKDLKEMKFLNAVVNETLRLYPAVPLNFRSALKDVTLPTGGGPDGLQPVGILKDTKVIYSIGCLQKNPDMYPPNSEPLEWKPERWVDGSWTPDQWHFLPFHHGKRACPGQKMAQIEMAYTATRILQSFTGLRILGWDIVEGKDRDLKCKVAVTMTPAEQLKCEFF